MRERLWGARGFFGGLAAIGLAALGQQALVERGDQGAAGVYYLAAIVLLVASLLRVQIPRSKVQGISLSEAKGPRPVGAVREPPLQGEPPLPSEARQDLGMAEGERTVVLVQGAELAAAPVGAQVGPGVGARPRIEAWQPDAGSAGAQAGAAAPVPGGGQVEPHGNVALRVMAGMPGIAARPLPVRSANGSRGIGSGSAGSGNIAVRVWRGWRGMRAALGWRGTAGGLAVALALASASWWVLKDDIGNPFGGWLWAGSLAALLITFAGTEGWPRGNGLLPGPRSDFFGRGVPAIGARWEALLMGVVLLVALGLRLWNLEYHPGIFGDEGERGLNARAINEGAQANIFGYGWWGVPNLYFYLVAGMLRVFGDSMVGDRMLSVISGIVTVWFVYRTARLLWGPRAGLIAGALVAVAPLSLQFSRVAGESTPTGALWAGGFYYLLMALRYRRPLDWALAGVFWGFSLYFYAAGKLIIPLVGAVLVYCALRWHVNFVKRYALGFGLLLLAFGLTFLPMGIFAVQDKWQGFTGRAQETSIFSPQNQPQAFDRYKIPYDQAWQNQPVARVGLANPWPWAQLMFHQMRVTTEVIYLSRDPTAMYQIDEHGGSMLPPVWAALALLGLAYGAWKVLDARWGIADIWFWGGMMGAALTMDTPSVQRLVGAWPALMLFVAALLDRVFAAAWPLNLGLARRWATVPLAGLVVFFAGDGYREYFGHYASLCPYCDATTQARYVQALGQDYHAYQLGVGTYYVPFNYGSTRFAAKGVEGEDVDVPVDYLPVTNNKGKGVAFVVYQMNIQYLPLIKLFYPGGKEEQVVGADGVLYFTGYKVSREQMAQFQAVNATYVSQGKEPVTRREQTLGSVSQVGWKAPPGLSYPAQALWEGGIVAPSYGMYTLRLSGPEGSALEVDGRQVLGGLAGGDGKGAQQADMALARGMHSVRLTGTLRDANDRIEVGWAGAGGQPGPVPASRLYAGPTGGLSGEIGPVGSAEMITATDPFDGKPVSDRRSDPAMGFREATKSLGATAWTARWQGSLMAPLDGTYTFETGSNGPSAVLIDGQVVVNNQPTNGVGQAAGQIELRAGPHKVDLRYMWSSGQAGFEWYWTTPGGGRNLVPPTALTPKERSWPRDSAPDPPPPPAQVEVQGPSGETDSQSRTPAPDAVLGAEGELSQPRGVAVDAEGNVYVGDRGHHRVAVFGKDGKLLRTFGKAAPASSGGAENPQPGELAEISDVAVSGKGEVYALDSAARVQVFGAEGDVRGMMTGQQLSLFGPNGIFAAGDGSVYIADTGQNRVLALPGGDAATRSELKGGDDPRFPPLEQPVDVVVPAQDGSHVYAIDLRDRIVEMSPEGAITRQWGLSVGREDGGSRLACSPDGSRVYMTDPERRRVVVLSTIDGAISYLGEEGRGPGQFSGPSGIATGPDGRVYVVDRGNNNVQVFTVTGP